MRLLIIHPHSRLTGVTTFVGAVASEFERRGHDVVVSDSYVEGHDVVFTNYAMSTWRFKEPTYHFVHGLMSDDYMPLGVKIDGCFVFGERAKEFLKARHSLDSVLIRNGIDLSRFKPAVLPSSSIKNIFVFDGRHGFALAKFVEESVEKAGLSNVSVTSLDSPIEDVRQSIHDADLVVGIGRSLFEAMACGKPCINMGIRCGDGYVTEENFQDMLVTNGSGWTNRTIGSIFEPQAQEQFAAELNKYDFKDGAKMRRLAVLNLGMREQVDIILNTIKDGNTGF